MSNEQRSGCPINLALEVIGDRWSLIILRDMIFGGKRHYRELLNESVEGISTNILADRLKALTRHGMLTRSGDPSHKQKALYSLTEKSIALVPVLAQLGIWSRHHLPVDEEMAAHAKLLEEGGPALWRRLMDELRGQHLAKSGRPDAPKRRSLQR